MISVKGYRSTAAVAVTLVISSFAVLPAHADPTPAPTISADPFKSAMEQFKKERENFMAAMRDRSAKMRDINTAFKTEVDKANLDARNALATASTPLQKSTIAAARRNAIDAAISARDTAIAALGDMPVPPTEPVRQSKPMGMNDSRDKVKR